MLFKIAPVRALWRRRPKLTSRATPEADKVFRVLVSSRAPSHRTQFVDQLQGDDSAGGAPRGINFDFSDQLSGRLDADVLLLTTAAAVLGGSRAPEEVQADNASQFVENLKRQKIALVRALHADSIDGVETPSRAEAILNQATTSFVAMSVVEALPDEHAVTVIHHSHLRDRFLGHPKAPMVPGRLVFIAAGVLDSSYEAPLKVFGLARLPGWTLRVVGKVPRALADSFDRTLARHSTRITLVDETLSDGARVMEITQAELVVVAAPDSYEAMSKILLALSFDRPVLVEETPVTRMLADEVGQDWVQLHHGRLTATSLEAALERLRSKPPTGRPNLDARSPNAIAAQYASALRAAASRR